MLKRIAIELSAAIIPLLFLNCALRLGCGFNFIPFALHQALVQDVMDENTFIRLFDVIIAVALFLFIRWMITTWLFKRRTMVDNN